VSGSHPVPPLPPAKPGLPARTLSFLVGVFTRNLPVKLAALLLALIVWFTVRQDLTAEYVAEHCQVVSDLPPGLVWLDPPPKELKVTFRGPRSQIDAVKKSTSILLDVRVEDLLGGREARITFTPERGNVRHAYGEDIEISSLDGASIELRVAKREKKRVAVLPPAVAGVPTRDWRVEVSILTPEITVFGPRSSLDQVSDIQPEPVDASWLFEGRTTVEPVGPVTIRLSPPAALEELRIGLAEDAVLECKLDFPLNIRTESMVVPFEIWDNRPNPDLQVRLKEVGLVRRSGERFELELEFQGAPSDLVALRRAVERGGEVIAYVLTEDSEGYRTGAEGDDFIHEANVYVKGLPPGVRHLPPSESIQVEVVTR
jgi:hypothetical protein